MINTADASLKEMFLNAGGVFHSHSAVGGCMKEKDLLKFLRFLCESRNALEVEVTEYKSLSTKHEELIKSLLKRLKSSEETCSSLSRSLTVVSHKLDSIHRMLD